MHFIPYFAELSSTVAMVKTSIYDVNTKLQQIHYKVPAVILLVSQDNAL